MGKVVQLRRTYSLKAAADILARSENTLRKWLEQGCPAEKRGDKDLGIAWELYLPDVIEWRVQRAVAEATERYIGAADGDEMSAEEADRRRKVALAVQEEAKADELCGSVVRLDDVVTEVASMFAAVKAKLSGVGAFAGGRFGSVGSPAEMQSLVDERIREALNELVEERAAGPRA